MWATTYPKYKKIVTNTTVRLRIKNETPLIRQIKNEKNNYSEDCNMTILKK